MSSSTSENVVPLNKTDLPQQQLPPPAPEPAKAPLPLSRNQPPAITPTTTNNNNNNKPKPKFEPLEITNDDPYNSNGDDKTSGNSSDDGTDSELETFLPELSTKLYAGNQNQDADLDELLGIDMDEVDLSRNSSSSKRKKSTSKHGHGNSEKKRTCCIRNTLGNMIILHQPTFERTGYGIIGPHYPGVIFTVGLLLSASYYMIQKAYFEIGPLTTISCIGFTVMALFHLFRVVSTDPGIVSAGGNRRTADGYEGVMVGEEEGWSYCGLCSIYQPPNAAHCPDCNVCVDGYDHHCPWMGTCIGKRNISAFMSFNMTWLIYLVYSCIWVVALGPHRERSEE